MQGGPAPVHDVSETGLCKKAKPCPHMCGMQEVCETIPHQSVEKPLSMDPVTSAQKVEVFWFKEMLL